MGYNDDLLVNTSKTFTEIIKITDHSFLKPSKLNGIWGQDGF